MVTDHKCESTQKLDRARSQQETSFGSKGWNCYRVPSTIIAVSPLRFAQLIGQNAMKGRFSLLFGYTPHLNAQLHPKFCYN